MKPLLSSLALLACAFAPARAADLPPDALELFRWFDTLGYPDITKAPWIETWREQNGNSPDDKKGGFLLREHGGQPTILLSDLFEKTITKEMQQYGVRYAERPFAPAMRQLIADVRNIKPSNYTTGLDDLVTWQLSLKNRLFVLAHASWKKAEPALAADLFALFLSQPARNLSLDPIPGDTPRAALERELAILATWQAILLLGPTPDDPTGENLMARPALLALFKDIESKYPRNPEAPLVREIITSLSRQIAEDTKHPKLTAEQITQLPIEDQVRAWILQLPDQRGVQLDQPGECYLFEDYTQPDPNSPAFQLARIGLPAVPQLIEALDDYRLIRAVQYKRDYLFSHRPLVVGDAALQILNRISGKQFAEIRITAPPYNPDRAAKARAEANAWWKEAQPQK